MVPVQFVALAMRASQSRTIPALYHRVCCRIVGLKLRISGKIASSGPVLYVVNHTSYVDISVLGSILIGSFVAKREVAEWPFLGMLARLQKTVFVDRRVSSAADQKNEIAARLRGGDNLILFPEGTSSDGNRILPFKSALFSVAQTEVSGQRVVVQPVSIAYTHLDGMPLGRSLRPYLAWYGDMDLASHVWHMMGLGKVTVSVAFHEPVDIEQFGSRKGLSEYCYAVISRGVAAALSGRSQVLQPAMATAAQ